MTEMTKVNILLDIDGTINPRGTSAQWLGQWSENIVTRDEAPAMFEGFPRQIESLTLKTNSQLLERMASLSIHENIEIHWFTAWTDDTHSVFCPKVGFKEGLLWNIILPDEETEDLHEDSDGWWKTTAIRRFLNTHANEHVVWIDDMVDLDDKMIEVHEALCDEFSERLAIIGVPGHLGITPDIFNFVERISTRRWQSGFMVWDF